MARGGKRINCGRKKIDGQCIKIKLNNQLIKDVNSEIDGNTQAEKIRKCIEQGLNFYKKESIDEGN